MVASVKKLIDRENKRMTEQETWYELEFEFLGYTAKVIRYDKYNHLCGYVKTDFDLSDEMYEALDNNAHGGITYDNENWIGFDCNHAFDFNLARYYQFKEIGLGVDFKTHLNQETYRDLEYVVETLKNMISAIADKNIIRNEGK